MVGFERHVGAAADAKELEYISALHQTDLGGVRTNATIKAEDVSLFMLSRFGIAVTEEEVKDTILDGLGCGNSEDESIDLMEVVATLFIPMLLKAAKVEAYGETLSDKYEKPDPDILQKTLTMILKDVTGDSEPKPLNKELIRRIFTAYGEKDLAEDDCLHEEMLGAAQYHKIDGEGSEDGGGTPKPKQKEQRQQLNLHTFAAGLTHDIHDYDIRNETRSTTHYDDVMLTKDGRERTEKTVDFGRSGELTMEELQYQKSKSALLLKRKTAASIDSTAGTYRSKFLIIFLWVTGIMLYFAYWFDPVRFESTEACPEYEYSRSNPWIQNADTMACETGFSALVWLSRFIVFSLFGLVFVGFGSFGNGVEDSHWWRPLFGLLVTFIFTVSPFVVNADSSKQQYLNVISLLFGMVVCLFHLSNFLNLVTTHETRKKYSFLRVMCWTGSMTDLKELKQAGQKKLCSMASNALDIHQDNSAEVLGSHFGRGLHNFALKGHVKEPIGGLQWTWRRILDRSIHSEYGLWYSDRLISSNIAQFIVSIYVLLFGLELTRNAIDNFDSGYAKEVFTDASEKFLDTAFDEVLLDSLLANFTGILGSYVDSGEVIDCPNISGIENQLNESAEFFCSFAESAVSSGGSSDLETQLALLEKAGFDTPSMEAAARAALAEAAGRSVDSLYPTEDYMIFWPMFVGTIFAFLTAVYLAFLFLPSITSTIFRLRSGMIPTLHDRHFNKYRFAGDQVSILTGSMFWGALISSALVGGMVGLIVFLFLWQAAIYFVQRAAAFLIGVIAVALFRICLLQVCRFTMYKAFYRKRPLQANVTLLGLEWANFTLSVAFVVVRAIKLLITAGFYIGRIDTPFLAKGVGKIKNFELDNYPTVYLKDLLSHEAHRHPYIETLGTMYLMKLRYPAHFGKRAGSAWRLLFVYALMPWMHKYRIHGVEDHEAPLLLQQGGGGGATTSTMVRAGAVISGSVFTRSNFDRIASQMKKALKVRRKYADDQNEDPYDDDEGAPEELVNQAIIAREKSVKLELENEALRNRIARLEQAQRQRMSLVADDNDNDDDDNNGTEVIATEI